MLEAHPLMRRLVYATLALLGLGLVVLAYWALTIEGEPPGNTLRMQIVYCAVVGLAGAMCVLRGALVASERGAWLAIGAGILCWASGEALYNFVLTEPIPYPSLADAGYLLFYPCMYTGLWLLASSRWARLRKGLWLDGAIAFLAMATLAAVFLYGPLSGMIEGEPSAVLVNLSYPLGDMILIGLVVCAIGLCGWHISRDMLLIAVAIAFFWLSDTIYMYQSAHGTYVDGGAYSLGWVLAPLLLAYAAWRQPPPAHAREINTDGSALSPLLCGAIVTGLLVYGNFAEVNALALGLAAATVVAVLARMRVVFFQARDAAQKMREASVTDPLTGMPNRRKLIEDLERVLANSSRVPYAFALFDLDEFKAYNDTFGHSMGDQLLQRLGRALVIAAEADDAYAYRLGGDEFCLLLKVNERLDERLERLQAILYERAGELEVTSSYGMALLPLEASTLSGALRLADQRMYAMKSGGRTPASSQMRDMLLTALAERSEDLGEHNDDVSVLAAAVARRLGLGEEQVVDVVRAAQLHDVGKVAVPDSILFKPGPLTDDEWEIMHQHTLVGERILAAAPALRPVAVMVRSSHERYDGGGYPDGIAGTDIPLGARIITACDSYDAMTTDRPYRKGMSHEQAVQELRSCAATQFDPEVVEVLIDVLEERRAGKELAPVQAVPRSESAQQIADSSAVGD